MIGAICTRDILLHPIVTVRAFGWRVYFRAVFQGQGETFLSLLQREGFFAAPPAPKEPELIERCIRLELQAAAIYHSLTDLFSSLMPFRNFLNELADEEAGTRGLVESLQVLCQPRAIRAGSFPSVARLRSAA